MYYQFFSLEERQAIAQREENKYASLMFFLSYTNFKYETLNTTSQQSTVT